MRRRPIAFAFGMLLLAACAPAAHREPRHLVLERPCETATRTRPRYALNDYPMLAAPYPRRLGFDKRPLETEVQCAPHAQPVATVVPGASTAAVTASTSLSANGARSNYEPRIGRLRIDPTNVFKHRALDTERPKQHLRTAHFSSPRGSGLDNRTLRRTRGARSFTLR